MIPITKQYYDSARLVKYDYEKTNNGYDVEINGIKIQLRKCPLNKVNSETFAFGSNS